MKENVKLGIVEYLGKKFIFFFKAHSRLFALVRESDEQNVRRTQQRH